MIVPAYRSPRWKEAPVTGNHTWSICWVIPHGSRISSVRGFTASAREFVLGSSRGSTIRGAVPYRVRNSAAANPTGPAPAKNP